MNSRKYVYIQRTQNHPIDIDFEILKDRNIPPLVKLKNIINSQQLNHIACGYPTLNSSESHDIDVSVQLHNSY